MTARVLKGLFLSLLVMPASGLAQETPATTDPPGAGETVAAETAGETVAAEAASGEPAEAVANTGGEGTSEAATPGASGTDVPWAGAVDAVPAFLDTTDRRIADDRPPPTVGQVAALREMEAEVARFAAIGGTYRDTVVSIVRREYLRQRRAREERYSGEIRYEEQLEDEARLKAIAMFEAFVERYPNDPTYTPDAMFRLGELYFERTAIAYQEEMNAFLSERERRFRANESTGDMVEPDKDFAPTIELYRRIVQQFPGYAKLDGVYYLIGYCLAEMGNTEEARLAWLSLVCGNHFSYKGHAPSEESGAQPDTVPEHPALTLDPRASAAPGIFVDPFEGCVPVVADSKFFAETWLRVGEHHFDFDFKEHGLERAISAYKKVLERPDDRNYNLALYKVAWAYYRASRYPEALQHFWQLVQWSDDERGRTGKGSELRSEAIQYLGIGFAYDDWNENQVPDPSEGMPRGIERLQNASLMPQDRAWTAEVYFKLGYIYFDEAKYPAAIEVWQLALQRWSSDPQAPEIQNMIARAYTRNNEAEAAIAARARLSDYGEGSDWWDANKDHPVEQRNAERLAEEALINTAINHHQRAQTLRRRCVEERNLELCRSSQEEYGFAATAYRNYIQRYPNNPQAYELQYNMADALYWAQNYEDAAREYAAVRDSNLDDEFLSESARLVVESVKRLVDQATEAGQLETRTEPPIPQGSPPRVLPIALPQLLQRLAQAREMYLARVDERHDAEGLRQSYRYNNTLFLYLYGYWDLARTRFREIFEEHCVGEHADETGRVAWVNLRNMAVAVGDTDAVRDLGTELQRRQCTFSSDAADAGPIDCSKAENKDAPRCIAGADLTNLRYQDAVNIFTQAERASGEEQRRLYERAATELVRAVNEEPEHPQAPLALEKAAIALERTSRFESAGRLYQRIIDEVGPRKGATPDEQKALDAILGNAYFRLAFNANRFFDYDRAVENYRLLADSQRFASSVDPTTTERREGALINAAKILEYQQQYARAGEYYTRAAATVRDAAEKRAARYRVAEMLYKQGQWTKMMTEMRSFIGQYATDAAAGELVVQAYWRIAEARKALRQTRDFPKALQDVVAAFERSGQAPGSYAAEYAANARFLIVDEGIAEFEQFEITAGKPATLKAYVESVTQQIEAGGNQAKTRAEGYATIPAFRRPTWTIAAFVRQGRIYEVLARAVLNTPFVVPADLQKKMKGLPDYAKDDIKVQVEDAIRQVLDAKVRPIECLAVARYALASRAARAGNVDDEYTRVAIDRINAYGDERIAECVAQAAAQDSSFAAYQPGEFTRAPRGQNLDIAAGVTPPSLEAGDR